MTRDDTDLQYLFEIKHFSKSPANIYNNFLQKKTEFEMQIHLPPDFSKCMS